MFNNIPQELRERRQWLIWRYEYDSTGRLTKVPYRSDLLRKASTTESADWSTFENAVETMRNHAPMFGLGFVFSDDDPYSGIDIDDKESNPANDVERQDQQKILEHFDSYTERSPSGRGFHIIVRGKLPDSGRDHAHVGLYSRGRYFTMTGDVVRAAPIRDYHESLLKLEAMMPRRDSATVGAGHNGDELMSDQAVFDMALAARNGDKFDALCRGAVTFRNAGPDPRYGHPESPYQSHSEADGALIALLAFYSPNNAQVRRLFRMSALNRPKATDSYINRWLSKVRATQPPPVDIEALRVQTQAMLQKETAPPLLAGPSTSSVILENDNANAYLPPSSSLLAPSPTAPSVAGRGYEWPPGLIGEVARYFYASAMRPVKDVALCYAIALFAGICGRAFNVSATGLNHYLLLIARTGRGKGDGPKAISRLVSALSQTMPTAREFIGPAGFSSGQALIRVLDSRPGWVAILKEFGHLFDAMKDPRAHSSMSMLKRALLDLYDMSGRNDVLYSTAYADSEKSTKEVRSPSCSIVGESTPGKFFGSLSEDDISDGFIPRFFVVECKESRPDENPNAHAPPPPELLSRVATLFGICAAANSSRTVTDVATDEDANKLLKAYGKECDAAINGAGNDAEEELYNRAHLRALRLAALIAVGVNPVNPVITIECAQWALAFVKRTTDPLLARFRSGDVGSGESRQLVEMRRLVREFFSLDMERAKAYRVIDAIAAHCVPYSYLVMRAGRVALFYKDRRGVGPTVKGALDLMLGTGELKQLSPAQALEKFDKREAVYFLGPKWGD